MIRAMSNRYKNDDEIKIVKGILEKSGIDCISYEKLESDVIKTDVDVFGVYKNVIVIIECVGTERFGRKLKKAATDFKLIIGEFDKLKSKISKDHKSFYKRNILGFNSQNKVFRKLLISFNKKAREDIDKSHSNLSEREKIYIWTKEEMYYYDRVSDCTYDHCKYEILSHLEVSPESIDGEEKPGPLIYLAYGKKIVKNLFLLNLIVPVRLLLDRSSIKRLRDASSEKGYQRLLDKKKLKKMRNYLLKETNPTYPNNIICALNRQTTIKEKPISEFKLREEERSKTIDIKRDTNEKLFIVELPNTYDIFEIIDGQHRLFSYAQTKYHLFEKIKSGREEKVKKCDKKIEELSKESDLMVTAIYSEDEEWGVPGKLFFDINTTQTKITSDDVIDLMENFYPKDPIASANKLLKKLNKNGFLTNKIKTKFWQKEKIKRTSLIRYSGLKQVFKKSSKTYRIFSEAHKKQKKIKDYDNFCFILINNFLRSLSNLVKDRQKKKFAEIINDLNLKNYYFCSAVFIGALIRFLRHFISEKDKGFNIPNRINQVLEKNLRSNIENKKLQKLFHEGLKPIADRYKFTKKEFKQNGWASNRWTEIEAELFYTVRDQGKFSDFGDEALILKKYRL